MSFATAQESGAVIFNLHVNSKGLNGTLHIYSDGYEWYKEIEEVFKFPSFRLVRSVDKSFTPAALLFNRRYEFERIDHIVSSLLRSNS